MFKKIIKNYYFSLLEYFTKPIKLKTKFIFITGCGHSGTTLVATLLGRSNDVMLIPEESEVFMQPNFTSREVLKNWDIISRSLDKKYCVEKTPRHISRIGKIFEVLPDSHVIFLTRNPIDNIGSLKKRSNALTKSIERWLQDNNAGAKWINDPRVLWLKYESIFEDKSKFLEKIKMHTQLNLDQSVFLQTSSQWSKDHSLVGETELLKKRISQITEPIYDTRGSGAKILSKEEQNLVKEKTTELRMLLDY